MVTSNSFSYSIATLNLRMDSLNAKINENQVLLKEKITKITQIKIRQEIKKFNLFQIFQTNVTHHLLMLKII